MRVFTQVFAVGLLAGFFGISQFACGSDGLGFDELYEHLVDPAEIADKDTPYFRMSSLDGNGTLVQTLISRNGKCFVYTDQIRVLQATKVSRRIGLVKSMGADEFLRKLEGLSDLIEAMQARPAQASIHPGPTIELRSVGGQVKIARLDVMDIGAYPKPIDAFLSLFRSEFFQSFEKTENEE